MRYVVAILAFFAAATAGHAACSAESAAERPHLVELYSAEGCSSCPPAETWLRTLRDSPKYIGLEYHVTYWDDGGWKDPYGDSRYTERQKALVKNRRDPVYTPQVVLDGRVWKKWPKGQPPQTPDGAPPIRLDVTPGNELRAKVTMKDATAPESYRVYLALSENGLTSAVKAGENRGKQLEHDLVVRDLAGPLRLSEGDATLKPPAGFNAANGSVVAFVQDEKSGDIVQALRLPLAECKP